MKSLTLLSIKDTNNDERRLPLTAWQTLQNVIKKNKFSTVLWQSEICLVKISPDNRYFSHNLCNENVSVCDGRELPQGIVSRSSCDYLRKFCNSCHVWGCNYPSLRRENKQLIKSRKHTVMWSLRWVVWLFSSSNMVTQQWGVISHAGPMNSFKGIWWANDTWFWKILLEHHNTFKSSKEYQTMDCQLVLTIIFIHMYYMLTSSWHQKNCPPLQRFPQKKKNMISIPTSR